MAEGYTKPPRDGAELAAAVEALRAEMRPEYEAVADFREHIAAAERAQSKAIAKYRERAKAVARLAESVTTLRARGAIGGPDADAAAERVDALQRALVDMDDVRPSTGSIFVRAFLGQVNVKAWNGADRVKLRDEYNKFKDRTNVGERGCAASQPARQTDRHQSSCEADRRQLWPFDLMRGDSARA